MTNPPSLFSSPAIRSFDALLPRLSSRLVRPLPGHEAHLTMAPRYPARREGLSIEGRSCREAGVLALLMLDNSEPVVVLTIRRDELPDHGGQISFPGGRREGDETLLDTALREAHEEIGLAADSVRLLGPLTPLYIPPSNFCVHPFLGAAPENPPLSPTDREVDCLLRIPLNRLLDPDTRVLEPRSLHGETVDVPYYDVDGHAVWGATAMMLAEVLAVVRDVLEPE